MSEDVKPRKIWTSGFHLETTAGDINQKISIAVEELGAKSNVKGDRFFWIELEPTMRMMDEMCEALDEIRFHEQKYVENSPEETTYYLRVTNKVLEKYRKFKDGLK